MSKTAPKPRHPAPFAYHAGPPDIVFAGRAWRRGVPQPVTPEELKSMTRRAGWVVFDFRQT
ncbi:MAG: hypothetical protein Q8S32_17240 [Burkholderiaceae bacterium]|nr:hypothetical protein [Burkholderiaceae bacterium]